MKKESRRCNKCKRIVFYMIPKKTVMGLFMEVEQEKKRPFVLRENKYWCKECWEKHQAEAEK